MATDIARLSYDSGRQYTGVMPQQGRVSLEAEENEEVTISLVERRAELVDIIGPCGTPDNGYAVSQGSGYDIIIGPGTMYVGGNRVTLGSPLDYDAQPDWLDAEADPAMWWVPVPTEAPGDNEWVILVLVERDVTAVEDPMLRDVALGGPDGAARLRLLQHFLRIGTQADTCAAALAGQAQLWLEDQGLAYDAASAELSSLTRLQVQFQDTGAPPDPCEPSVTGGYLGAENQAFRVQVNAVDPDSGNFSLLWGPDDASMLYRVTSDGQALPTLTFLNTPVDEYHQPVAGQAVEVLLDAAQLASSDGVVEGYVSSLTGEALVLTSSYDPSTKTLRLPDSVYLAGASSAPQLYLRAWQGLLTEQSVGSWVTLPGTGIQVRLTTEDNAAVHVGDYWVVAARPATPTEIYPARLLREGQPPDGPHMWACPLAVVSWADGELTVVDNCRNEFPPLTGITATGGGCCTVSVTPAQAQGAQLQGVIGQYTTNRQPPITEVTICLQPGRYVLDGPLKLGVEQSDLTIEGCGKGAVLVPSGTSTTVFAGGLVQVAEASHVTLRGLEIELPLVPPSTTEKTPIDFANIDASVTTFFPQRALGIGVRAVQTTALTVSDCTFRFPLSVETGTTPVTGAATAPTPIFEVGVLAQGEVTGLVLEGNTFSSAERLFVVGEEASSVEEAASITTIPVRIGNTQVLAGYLQTPAMLRIGSTTGATQQPPTSGDTTAAALSDEPAPQARADAETAPAATFARALLSDAVIKDNVFQGLTLPVYAIGDFGRVEIIGNLVRQCYAGMVLLSDAALAALDLLARSAVSTTQAAELSRTPSVSALLDPGVLAGSVLGRAVPLPADYTLSKRQTSVQHGVLAAMATEQTGTVAYAQGFLTGVLERSFGGVPETVGEDLKNVDLVLSEFDQAAVLQAATDNLDVNCAGNDVDCAGGLKENSGPPLVIWDLTAATSTGTTTGTTTTGTGAAPSLLAATAIVNGNRLIANGALVALVGGMPLVNVAANVMFNASGKYSLVLGGTSTMAAITGNVLHGPTLLPSRPGAPAPLDTWTYLNEVF